MKRFITRISIFSLFAIIFIAIIAYARGYRLDLKKKAVTSTGILAISSNPKAAKVYINGELKGATDLNLTLQPGIYTIDVKKDGYTNWKRQLSLKGELVLSADALLFPINPSLSPLTNLGIRKAFPLDQTGKVLIVSDQNDETKDGIYLFDASKKTFSLLPPLKIIILKKDLFIDNNEFKDAQVYFSPDYKQVVFETQKKSYLLSLEDENKTPFDVTESKETLLTAWAKEKEKERQKVLETFPQEMVKVATDSFHIISFSPDETKMLFVSKKKAQLPPFINPPLIATNQSKEERILQKDGLYLYDKKEDKNFRLRVDYEILNAKLTDDLSIENWKLKIENSLLWYPDSKHLLFVEKPSKISIAEYDEMGKQTVYSGPFQGSFFTTTTDGKLIVLTNLNPEINAHPDLYLIGIR